MNFFERQASARRKVPASYDFADRDHQDHQRELEDDQPLQAEPIEHRRGEMVCLATAGVEDDPGEHDIEGGDEDEPGVVVLVQDGRGVRRLHV